MPITLSNGDPLVASLIYRRTNNMWRRWILITLIK